MDMYCLLFGVTPLAVLLCALFGTNLVCGTVGVLFMTSISSNHPDQFVYQSRPLQVAKENVYDVASNSYLGLWDFLDANYLSIICVRPGHYTFYTSCPFCEQM